MIRAYLGFMIWLSSQIIIEKFAVTIDKSDVSK